MNNQNLTALICLPLLIIFIVAVAIMGMRSRIAFANKVFKANKNHEFEYESSQSAKKRRRLIFFQLILLIGGCALSVLIVTGILRFSTLVLGTYLILILVSIWIGHVVYEEIKKKIS